MGDEINKQVKMNKPRIEGCLLGYCFGFILGCGINSPGFALFNWLSQWTNAEPLTITIWKIHPLGVLMGLAMAINVMNLYYS